MKEDMVNNPKHYQLFPVEEIKEYLKKEEGIEVRDIIEAATKVNFNSRDIPVECSVNYCNTLKYLLRFNRKNNPLQDLEKAENYLKRLISKIKSNNESACTTTTTTTTVTILPLKIKKYKLIEDVTTQTLGKTLYRIKALRSFGKVEEGQLGGYIESEENLSHDGDCWVFEDAKVGGEARVYENAHVYGDAHVYGYAEVYGNARIGGGAKVYDCAQVFGNAWVFNDAEIYGNACVHEDTEICDNARVYGKVFVKGNASVYNNAIVYGNAKVCGYACVYGDAQVYGSVCICGDTEVFGKAVICETDTTYHSGNYYI